jgi:hypothetical protein
VNVYSTRLVCRSWFVFVLAKKRRAENSAFIGAGQRFKEVRDFESIIVVQFDFDLENQKPGLSVLSMDHCLRFMVRKSESGHFQSVPTEREVAGHRE